MGATFDIDAAAAEHHDDQLQQSESEFLRANLLTPLYEGAALTVLQVGTKLLIPCLAPQLVNDAAAFETLTTMLLMRVALIGFDVVVELKLPLFM